MNWFPQIGQGTVAQFPLSRRREWRAITNTLESGERIYLPDDYAGQIGWQLSYRDLADVEVQKLTSLFTACQGQFGAFTFIDPLANLLGWSEDLSRPDWQAGLLTSSGGVSDPVGTQRAWSISNPTPGVESLQQTLGISGDYVTCFSVWLRSDSQGPVTLQRDGIQSTALARRTWSRIFVSGAGMSGAAQSSFSITLNPGQNIDVWGLQVETQPYPSAYKQTSLARGIYEETWFAMDELDITSTSVGLSACDITLISRT